MNLLVSQNLVDVRPDRLPPLTRQGPVRMLFLSMDVLGWRTSSEQLIRATEHRDDIAAVHIVIRPPLWMKVLNRRVPGLWQHVMTPQATWFWLLRRWLRGPLEPGRFDLIHCNPQMLAGAAAALKSQHGYRLSMSCDTTDIQFERELNDLAPTPPQDRAVYAAADLILTLSRWVAGSLADDYGVDPARLLLMRPSSVVPAEMPVKSPRDGRLLRIAFVGNDFARKGGPRLLKWHQDRWADRVELHVASAEAAGFAPAKNVVWHGRLDHGKVIELLATADLLVHPTQGDMSALVVAEAQALGVPAVTSRLAGIPDLLVDGVSGLLVEPGDNDGFVAAVEAVLFDPTRHAAMSAAAYAFAKTELNRDVTYGRALDRMIGIVDGTAV